MGVKQICAQCRLAPFAFRSAYGSMREICFTMISIAGRDGLSSAFHRISDSYWDHAEKTPRNQPPVRLGRACLCSRRSGCMVSR
jgi:hypothetical protein